MNFQRGAAIAVGGAAAVAIVAGLMVAGSPAEQRRLKLDERRVSDLQSLARALERRHASTGHLPARLGDALDGLVLSALPVDPVTDTPYEYEVVGASRFRLCATFSTESGRVEQDFWAHGSGHHCFELDLSRQ